MVLYQVDDWLQAVPAWSRNENEIDVAQLKIPKQPPGTNNCGIIPIATFLHIVDPTFPEWTPKLAMKFRNSLLERLVLSSDVNSKLNEQIQHYQWTTRSTALWHSPLGSLPQIPASLYPKSWKGLLLGVDDTVKPVSSSKPKGYVSGCLEFVLYCS
jgi:hypothetical protein